MLISGAPIGHARAAPHFAKRCGFPATRCASITNYRNQHKTARFDLNAPLSSSICPLTVRCRLGDYTRAMMIKRILTICAAAAAGTAGISLVQAQQAYPAPPGSVYTAAPPAYPEYRRGPGAPDFDALEDDEAPAGLPPPGPVMSPDDPRYGRPAGQPVYSDRGAPMGPVVSPDDPRYGRPVGPPPVYSDRGAPMGPVMSSDDPRYGRPAGPAVIYADRPGAEPQGYGNGAPNGDNGIQRPPGSVGPSTNVTGAVQPPGADGNPMRVAALPPEEQPDAGAVQL